MLAGQRSERYSMPKYSKSVLLLDFVESGPELALESSREGGDGGESTSGGAGAGEASHGREFSRPVLHEPGARDLGGGVHPFSDRARGALAAVPGSARAVR